MTLKEDLRKQILLEELSDDELSEIADVLTQKQYMKNESIFKEQESTVGIYMIKSGNVEIKRKLHLDTKTKMLIMLRNISSSEIKHSSAGWEHVFSSLEAGHFFGELSVIENRKTHSAEAVATENTELFVLPKEYFFELENTNPVMLVKIMKLIARASSVNLRQLNRRVLKALIGS